MENKAQQQLISSQYEQWGQLPIGLRELPQWVVAGKDKIPLKADRNKASVIDASTWCDFDTACKVAQDNGLGIGFVITKDDPFTCIDIDIVDQESQSAKGQVIDSSKWTSEDDFDRYRSIIKNFNSYTEISLNGQGIHIWVKGNIGSGMRRDSVEVYSQERYMICTGNTLINHPIADAQVFLDNMQLQMKPQIVKADLEELPETLSDNGIFNFAINAANADKFNNLCKGDWSALGYPSQSEADCALMAMFTYYSQSNEQCRRLFRMSGLGKREKAVKNNTYLNNTLRFVRSSREQEATPVNFSQILIAADELIEFQNDIGNKNDDIYSTPETNAFDERLDNTVDDNLPDSLEWPPGFTGVLAKFIFNSSYSPIKEISISAALGLLAGVCGRAYRTPTGKDLALYLILVARSGVGKDAIHDGIPKLIELSGILNAKYFVRAQDFVSGPALQKEILDRPGFLNLQGEIGRKLKGMATSSNTPMQTLRTVITNCYSKDYLEGLSYSDNAKTSLGVNSPALSLLGETTPDTFLGSLTNEMMEDGFMSRFTVINHDGDRPLPNNNRINKLDPNDLKQWKALLNSAIKYQGILNIPPQIFVDYEEDSFKYLNNFEVNCINSINASNNEYERQVYNRAHLKALKIASLMAVSDDCKSPKIKLCHAEYSINIVRKDIGIFMNKMKSGDIGTDDYARDHKILTLIKKFIKEIPAPSYKIPDEFWRNKTIPRSYFQQQVSKHKAFLNHNLGATKALDLTLCNMVDNGYLKLVDNTTNKISGKHYIVVTLPDHDF